jgi:hypothetical protein
MERLENWKEKQFTTLQNIMAVFTNTAISFATMSLIVQEMIIKVYCFWIFVCCVFFLSAV